MAEALPVLTFCEPLGCILHLLIASSATSSTASIAATRRPLCDLLLLEDAAVVDGHDLDELRRRPSPSR